MWGKIVPRADGFIHCSEPRFSGFLTGCPRPSEILCVHQRKAIQYAISPRPLAFPTGTVFLDELSLFYPPFSSGQSFIFHFFEISAFYSRHQLLSAFEDATENSIL
jgi:hypothetical protein